MKCISHDSTALPSTDIRKVLDAFLKDMDRRGKSKATLDAYGRDIRQLIAFCESEGRSPDIAEIDAELIERWDSTQVDKLAPASRNRRLAALAAMFDFARKRRLIKEDTMDLVDRAREVEREAPCPTRDEVERILEAEDREDWRLVFLFMAETGLRRSELIDLTVSDLNLEKPEVVVRHGKGDKRRVVPILSEELLAQLQAHVEGMAPGDQLFHSSQGGPLTGNALCQRLRRAIRRAGMEASGFTPHSLRHHFCTQRLNDGHPVHIVQNWAGHADPSMILKVYAHVQEESANARVAAATSAEQQAIEPLTAARNDNTHGGQQTMIPLPTAGIASVNVTLNGTTTALPVLGVVLVLGPGASTASPEVDASQARLDEPIPLAISGRRP